MGSPQHQTPKPIRNGPVPSRRFAGIPEEYLETLTERGLRLDQADFAPGGTGLGLAIAREITEAAGGTLSLHNRNPGLEVRLEFSLAAPRRNLTSS